MQKKVYKYSLEGNYLGEYSSTVVAARLHYVTCSSVSSCALSYSDATAPKRITSAGFIWSYDKKDYIEPHIKDCDPEVRRRTVLKSKAYEKAQQARCRPVVAHYESGDIVYPSVKAAASALGISVRTAIGRLHKGLRYPKINLPAMEYV